MSESAPSIASVVCLLTTSITSTTSTLAFICTLAALVALMVHITLRLVVNILGRFSKWIRYNEESLTLGSTGFILFYSSAFMLYLMTDGEVHYPTAQWWLAVFCTGCMLGVGTVTCLLAAIYRLRLEWSKPSPVRTSLDPPTQPPAEHNTSDSMRELSSGAESYRTALANYRAARKRHADAMRSYENARVEMEQAWYEAEGATREVTRALHGKKLKGTA